MAKRRVYEGGLSFEEALAADADLDVVEVPLSSFTFSMIGFGVVLFASIVCIDILRIGVKNFDFYAGRAQGNLSASTRVEAPRGIVVDKAGMVIADNRVAFSLLLDTKIFIQNPSTQETTLADISAILGILPSDILNSIADRQKDQISDPLLLAEDITDEQVVKIHSIADTAPALIIQKRYKRFYPDGPTFASVLGYTSLATIDDLKKNPALTSTDSVGRSGIEAFYDAQLHGEPGVTTKVRDARGNVLEERVPRAPVIGETLHLTIDGELQKFFADALQKRLREIGRTNGVALAINPKNGAILAMASFPTFDNNVFSQSGGAGVRNQLLSDRSRPLFNRAVSGVYNPGSTIKPLVGIAALAEHIVPATREFFSPGYLEIPNPYHPENPTRFLDWRFQGNVNLYSAIAQSSNVYFYIVGGGGRGVTGLGISRLRQWWERFGLGKVTGIDLPGERSGFLPSPQWKESSMGTPWLLGDTYNVSIGQGDVLLTPIQLLTYTGALANGGTIYKPFLVAGTTSSTVNQDLTSLHDFFVEAQKGMRLTVTSPKGTAYLLHDLPVEVAAKTGSAQILNNTQENAFFIGYAPYNNPEIAIMILIENSKEGSLNAVPVARQVFQWYYEHRLKNK